MLMSFECDVDKMNDLRLHRFQELNDVDMNAIKIPHYHYSFTIKKISIENSLKKKK